MSSTPASGSTDQASPRHFQCPHCSKDFSRRENLSRHLKTHDLVKPHRCSICNKEFTRSDLRQRHEAIHTRGLPQRTVVTPGRSTTRRRQRGLSNELDSPSTSIQLQSPEGGLELNAARILLGDRGVAQVGTGVSPFQYGDAADVAYPSIGADGTPANLPVMGMMDGWFDNDFYAALAETGLDINGNFNSSTMGIEDYLPMFDEGASNDILGSGRLSRMSSPPNEPSQEDKWPYAWNPRSHAILTAKPVNLDRNHPLMKNHDPRFDISEARYDQVKRFLRFAHDHGLGTHTIEMPSLAVANVFIELFFKHFEPQMPVIHTASLRSSDSLPDGLISIMITIGAIYSAQRHTRRFAIVLLEITRFSIQMSLEVDNGLMREPLIIYSAALVCYTGLWCGNKRAFELAEIMRGAVITYIRRIRFTGSCPTETPKTESTDGQEAWKAWISAESRKRLCWVIYEIDCQFPTLLYLPATISLGELVHVGCPCDEEFWNAPTARKWKRLLGPASVPPSRSFISAVSPFLGPLDSRHLSAYHSSATSISAQNIKVKTGSYPHSLGLNTWTRFLVLLTLFVHIYEFSQQVVTARAASAEDSDEDDELDDHSTHVYDQSEDPAFSRAYEEITGRCTQRTDVRGSIKPHEEVTFKALARRKVHLQDMLMLWSNTFMLSPPPEVNFYSTSRHFHESASICYRLALLVLHVGVSDLQDILGKNGTSGITTSRPNLSRIFNRDVQLTKDLVVHAIKFIKYLSPTSSEKQIETTPYAIISLFLAHAFVWACVRVANTISKSDIRQAVRETEELRDLGLSDVVQRSLSPSLQTSDEIIDESDPADPQPSQRSVSTSRLTTIIASASTPRPPTPPGDPRLIMRGAAETLTRMGTWGCSLTLAVMVHQRTMM